MLPLAYASSSNASMCASLLQVPSLMLAPWSGFAFEVMMLASHEMVLPATLIPQEGKQLRECRTMWGEREQVMHYSIDCYVVKAILLEKYQITPHKPFMHDSTTQTESFVLPAHSYSGCCS